MTSRLTELDCKRKKRSMPHGMDQVSGGSVTLIQVAANALDEMPHAISAARI